MSWSTLAGIVCGVVILVAAIALSADDPSLFVNLPGLALVLGGTAAATLVSFPAKQIGSAFAEFGRTMLSGAFSELQRQLHSVKQVIPVLKQGKLRDMENIIDHIRSPFFHDGMQMVVDGASAEDIEFVLDWRMEAMRQNMRAKAGVFRAMAGFAPAFGMVGTLLGLVNMLGGMSSDSLETIGASMALALITTFYGIVLANILFKPMAIKIEQKLQGDMALLTIAREAVLFLQQQKNPAYAQNLLDRMMEQHEHEVT